MRRGARLAVFAGSVALAGACSTHPATPPAQTPGTTTAAAVTSTSVKPAPNSALRLANIDVRDKSVEFTFVGAGRPGVNARFVDAAASDGSGLPVAVSGESVLRTSFTGIAMPGDPGFEMWTGPKSFAGTGHISEVAIDTLFEGHLTTFVGRRAPAAPFTVAVTENPPRVTVTFAS